MSLPIEIVVLVAVLGVGVAGAGGWLAWRCRRVSIRWRRAHSTGEEEGGPPRVMGLTLTTAMVVSLTLLFVGYHVAAWVLPDAWTPLKVPSSRWWLVALGASVAVGASVLMDRFEGEDAHL